MKNQQGYTLVELLASIIVIIIVGTIVVSIFVSGLRGTNKTTSVNSATQNGNYALSQMVKMIHGVKTFEGMSSNSSDYITDCTATSPPNEPTPTPTHYQYMKFLGLDGGETVLACSYSLSGKETIASISASGTVSLLDFENVTLSDCYFTCKQADITEPPIVGINFSLNKSNSGNLFENQASASAIPFSTSTTFRNVIR